MEFSYQVTQWAERGVPFKTHLYVPEVHPVTQENFHEREDEGHVFKVYSTCMYVQYVLQCALFNPRRACAGGLL